MIDLKINFTEKERLEILHSFHILDTPPEKDFDDIVLLASQVCETPIAYVSLIDSDRQWFKSAKNFPVKEAPRKLSICADSIYNRDITIIEDAKKHQKYMTNPAVTGPLKLVFYASCPIVTKEGFPIGTVCVLDKKSRTLNAKQKDCLRALSRQAVNYLELRKSRSNLEKNYLVVKAKNKMLDSFSKTAIEKITTPVNTIRLGIDMLGKSYKQGDKIKVEKYKDLIDKATVSIEEIIEDINIAHYHLELVSYEKEKFDLNEALKDIVSTNRADNRISITYPESKNFVFMNKELFKTISKTLLDLSIHLSLKDVCKIEFKFEKTKELYILKFYDKNKVRFNEKKVLESESVKHSLSLIRALTQATGWGVDYSYDENFGNKVVISISQ